MSKRLQAVIWNECTFTVFADCARLCETAISTAPPPGTNLGSKHTFLATPIASCKFLSTYVSYSCHYYLISIKLLFSRHCILVRKQQNSLERVSRLRYEQLERCSWYDILCYPNTALSLSTIQRSGTRTGWGHTLTSLYLKCQHL